MKEAVSRDFMSRTRRNGRSRPFAIASNLTSEACRHQLLETYTFGQIRPSCYALTFQKVASICKLRKLLTVIVATHRQALVVRPREGLLRKDIRRAYM